MKLIKIITFIYFILLSFVNANAQNKNMTCTNNETNFITNFKIDINDKKITHLSSLNSKNNQRYVVNEDLKILSFDKNIAITISYSNNDAILNLKIFNFKEQTYTQSGHYLDIKQKPYSQLFECVLN